MMYDLLIYAFEAIDGENQLLVTNEPVEFSKYLFKFKTLRKN